MKKNLFYTLQKISGTAQLLPFGQAVAAQRPGIRLVGSGELIWSLLDQCQDQDELIELALLQLDISDTDRAEAETDLREFIHKLEALGILHEENDIQSAAESESRYGFLQVGPINVELRGMEDLFHPDFAPFLLHGCPEKAADQTVTVTCSFPPDQAGMTCLLQNYELEVYQGNGRILMRFPTMPDIEACILSKDGTIAVFYIRPSYEKDRLQNDLFHAIRHAVLYKAQKQKLFVLHSVSILYRDFVWLFSAPAGTGKSTHANLWKTSFDTPVINGDLAMLSISDSGPRFHSIPWCGTSGIAKNVSHPLGGVIFLQRGHDNTAKILPSDARQLRLANRMISPVWTEHQLITNLDFAGDLSSRTGMWELTCTANSDAAFCMKEAIDRYLGEEHIYG